MPACLRPTAPIAANAVLVGDPGRALLLAQELLEEPRMSNHARGLWGYYGLTATGKALTIQSTGIGGPSAALVLAELAGLGVRRAVRVGTCAGLGEACELGELLVVTAAVAEGGSAALGAGDGEAVAPDADLEERLRTELAEQGRPARVVSYDVDPQGQATPAGVIAADMQTAALFARARSLGIDLAAVLIVAVRAGGEEALEKEQLELAEKRAGRAAAAVLSP